VDTAVEAGRLGAFSYLEKPYDFDGLIEKLKEAYEARLKKKFQNDDSRMEELNKLSMGDPLSVLASLKRLDDDVK
jgi:DNA-binding NtrC family response regulator